MNDMKTQEIGRAQLRVHNIPEIILCFVQIIIWNDKEVASSSGIASIID